MAHLRLFRRFAILLLLGVPVITGCGPKTADSPQSDSGAAGAGESTRQEDPLSRARRMLQLGDLQSAAKSAYEALVRNPERADAKLLASEIEAERGNHQVSADLAGSIDIRSRLGQRAVVLHFQALVSMDRPLEAANVLLDALELFPEDDMRALEWRRQAWQLLCRVGRRQEASHEARIMCRAGEASRVELFSLARRNDAFPYSLLPDEKPEKYFESGLGIARWLFTQKDFRGALDELSDQSTSGFESPAASALYGRLLVETQAFEEVPNWYASCNEDVSKFSDYWIALGTYFSYQHQYDAAAKALLKASMIDPTDYACASRLATVFESLGKIEESEQFRHRAALIYQVEFLAQDAPPPGQAGQGAAVARLLLELGRPFEAIGWTLHTTPNSDVNRRAALGQQLDQLNQDMRAIEMASEMSLVGIDPDRFNLEPALESLRKSSTPQTQAATRTPTLAVPKLVNVATNVGLEFQWYQDVDGDFSLIPLHEFMGGGIAIIDYDMDGWPDVYLAQGSGRPPTDACSRSNVLMRNIGSRYEPVTIPSGCEDTNYSSGLAAGDVNQDGFIDLWLGALGRNRLLINNGDGTFHDATDQWGEVGDRFTSSLAIADINGDTLPDLFEAVYVEMEGGFGEPEISKDGTPLQPSPIEQFAQSDRWFENLGDGRFRLHEISREIAAPGTSLGIIVTDFDDEGGNEVFVGNDARSNHFLVHQKEGELNNIAGAKGIAAGFSGEAEACMGIATGDFDRNGSFDMHIANYSKESANHYLQTDRGAFADRAIRYGVDSFTRPYVGFGTKAVDVDRNGWLDLIVTNGHVFDLRKDGTEFQMPAQFLMNLGDRFELASVEDPSGYWKEKYLGRSIAMTDFDRDGAIDFLVGHLHRPLALLHNQTRTEGHWVQFELVGTASERDAIGARITLTMQGGQQFMQWVTAGDGYLCSDEPMIDFGVADLSEIDRVEVSWPSGASQVFQDTQVGQRYLIVEGDESLHRR